MPHPTRFIYTIPLLCAALYAQSADYGAADFMPSDRQPVGYRGDGSGRFPAANPVLTWNEETGENIIWKTRMPGPTTSSPIVVGDRVFTMADPAWLVCCDRNSGKILWQQHLLQELFPKVAITDQIAKDYSTLFNDEWRYNVKHWHRSSFSGALKDLPSHEVLKTFMNEPGVKSHDGGNTGLPSIAGGYNTKESRQGEPTWSGPTFAPPVSDGKHVFIRSTLLPVVACFTLDGNKVWSKTIGKPRMPKNWNMRGRTMRVYGDYLYTTFHNPVVIDKRSGKVKHDLREVKVTKNGTMTTQLTIAGTVYILFGGSPKAVLIDGATGELAAHIDCMRPEKAGIKHSRECDTPYSGVCTIGDTSYMMLGSYPYNGAAMAAQYVKEGDTIVSKALWGTKVDFATWRGGVVAGDRFLVDGINLEYQVLDRQTGKIIKARQKNPLFGGKKKKGQASTARYGKGAGECTNNPVATETHFFLPCWTGIVGVIDAKTGELLHSNRTEPLFGSSPFLQGRDVYLRGTFHLYRIGPK